MSVSASTFLLRSIFLMRCTNCESNDPQTHMASCRAGECEFSLMRWNIRSAHSTLRTARALDDPYELKLYSTDRRSTWRSVRIERTEFAFSGSLQCWCIGHGWALTIRKTHGKLQTEMSNSKRWHADNNGNHADVWPIKIIQLNSIWNSSILQSMKLQFPHLHVDNTHIVSTNKNLEEEKIPDHRKVSMRLAC